MERVVFIGPGRVGLALGYALAQSGEVGHLLYRGRRTEPPEHPLFHRGLADYEYGVDRPADGTTALFLTVPDAALPEIAYAVASRGEAPPGCAVFHTAGALGTEVLAPLHEQGYAVGSLHPLRAIANPLAGRDEFRGSFFALSGEPDALRAGERIIRILEGRWLSVPTTRRPLYHAAAAMASNHLVFLLREAIHTMERAGIPEEEATLAIASLAQGTVENIAEMGVERALTGPLLRGDVETIELHLRALPREAASLYVALARNGLGWRREGLPADTVARLDDLFQRFA